VAPRPSIKAPRVTLDPGTRPVDWRDLDRRLRGWHTTAGRDLEIRRAASPWEVLVAEVMSHQTQIERVGPSWRAFVTRWPAPSDLAAASTRDLLAAWAGLGYNRRALALREAARAIVDRHAGEVPGPVADLDALPGIGPYTARAVAAIAFGEPVAPIDVNVRRVLWRGVGGDIAPAAVQAVGDAAVSRTDPRGWVNAVMDLAATVCLARAPRCGECPVADLCASRYATDVAPDNARTPAPPFESTNRWLRGRILRDLREAPPGASLAYEGPLGAHGATAVRETLAQLESEGFVELGPDGARIAGS
jgi:A/G-specific adenine glycosylase